MGRKILFSDNTSSIFSNSDSTDYAIEFILTFDKRNLWCAISTRSLNLNKTNYVHFTAKTNTKIDINVNFKMFKLIIFITKFLG
jgi:hypothetical protein